MRIASPTTETRQRGFSLFELVVVICVVALVIAAGLPHFEATLKQAHETAVKLSARALYDGIRRAQAMEMLDGLSGQTYDLPRFGDGTLDLSPNGFPAGTSRRPGDRLSARNCAEIWRAVLEPNPEEANDKGLGNFRATLDSSGKSAICVYSYEHGGNMRISYDPATGKVWADAHFKGSALADQQ